MKQQEKYVNFSKYTLLDGNYSGFSPDAQLSLNLDTNNYGFYITEMFDTLDNGCTFNRLVVKGQFNKIKTEVVIAASDTLHPVWLENGDLKQYFADESISPLKRLEDLKRLNHVRKVNTDDILLHELTGRYVWVCMLAEPLSFNYEGVLDGFKLNFPKVSFTEYFPEIYQENEFFDRYIAIFQTMFLDEEAKVDMLPMLLDYQSAPDYAVKELASWIGIDNKDNLFTVEQLRHIIENIDLYQGCKGTKKSMERIVELVTEIKPSIVEHFKWNSENMPEERRKIYKSLYGESANHFCIILDMTKAGKELKTNEKKLERLIDTYSMVGTSHKLVKLEMCSHTDAHCYLDINSALSVPEVASVDNITLGAHITVG